jgi:integrase
VAVEATCPTFQQIADDWFVSRQDKLKQTTLTDYTNKLENQIKPRFVGRNIDAIKRADCLKFKEEIAARGAKNNSDKCFMLLRHIFEYAIDREILEGENPARTSRSSRSDHIPTSYPLIKWEEMPDFLSTLSNNEGRGNPITVASVKFIFLTAQRVGAAIPSRWEEIDWNTNTWTVPAERMKGREGQTKEHQIPLSASVVEMLKTLEPMTGYSGFIFMSARGKSENHIGKESPNAYIQRMGYKGRMVAHSARHAIATFGQDILKVPYEIIDRHLAHKPAGKVRAAYDHATFWEERVALMQEWAELLCSNGLRI